MKTILRTWTPVSDSIPWTIWDRGDEFWEMRGEDLRHYSVIRRDMTNGIIYEYLQPLHDSPIPLEALRRLIRGWEVVEADGLREAVEAVELVDLEVEAKAKAKAKAVDEVTSPPPISPQPLTQASSSLKEDPAPKKLRSNSSSQNKRMKGVISKDLTKKASEPLEKSKPQELPVSNSGSQELKACLNSQACLTSPTSHEMHSQQDQEYEEEVLQTPCIHSMESWSSLSQWIPQHALFQPSLHHQAFSELSDTQVPSCPSQKYSRGNSHSGQVQKQNEGHSRKTTSYHQRESQKRKEIPSGPLFI